jgi:aminoglycoside phosphotransferase (APT) family kinase protein
MARADAPGALESAVAAFVASELGSGATRIERLDAFTTNAVFEVDAGGRPLVLKASALHDALRAEAWACARGADAGCVAPAILAFGRLDGFDRSAFLMTRVGGRPVDAAHPALAELGAQLRRLHGVRAPGFGNLAEASWSEHAEPLLPHRSWMDFLAAIVAGARDFSDTRAADAAAAAIDAHADALAAVETGSLCHGDLKAAHILVDAGGLCGVIDWGDAVVADPLWDVARFAHRADAESLSLLLTGYDPERTRSDALACHVPLYGALWNLVDAIVDHRLGGRFQVPLAAAMQSLARLGANHAG